MITFILVILGIVSNASASMLPDKKMSFTDPISIISNIYLLLGILFYGIAFILYALTLQRLPLNMTHPILTCGSISIVAICSVILFDESLSLVKIIGLLFLMIGVTLISLKIQ